MAAGEPIIEPICGPTGQLLGSCKATMAQMSAPGEIIIHCLLRETGGRALAGQDVLGIEALRVFFSEKDIFSRTAESWRDGTLGFAN